MPIPEPAPTEVLVRVAAAGVTPSTGRPEPRAAAWAVLDLVGGAVGRASLPILRDGGLLISIPSAGDIAGLRDLANGRIRVTGMLVEPDRAGIEAIAALAADGRLKADVAQTFPLEEASRAHDLGERGAIGGGKLVLTPGS